MAGLYYEERQWFAPWVYALIVTIAVAAGVIPLVIPGAQKPNFACALLSINTICAGAVFLAILNLLHLVTRVSNGRVHVQLGLLFPFIYKRIRIDEIVECRCVEYRPIRDAGGWGVRFGRFEGAPCRFYNARGTRGVFIRTARRNYIIGSQTPERLLAALVAAKGLSHPQL